MRLNLASGATVDAAMQLALDGRLDHSNRPFDCRSVAGRDPDLSHAVLEPLAQVQLGPAEVLDSHDPLAPVPHDATNQVPRHTKDLDRVVPILRTQAHRFGRHQLLDELTSERHRSGITGDINALLAISSPVSHLDFHACRGLELGFDAATLPKDGALCKSRRELSGGCAAGTVL